MRRSPRNSCSTWSSRNPAASAARRERFLGAGGKPLPFLDAVIGGKSVGVPGALRTLERAHCRYGKLLWKALFTPAITLAEDGFAPPPRLAALAGHGPCAF